MKRILDDYPDKEEFYRQFKRGERDDQEDFMIWSGIYEMQLQNKKKLVELEC